MASFENITIEKGMYGIKGGLPPRWKSLIPAKTMPERRWKGLTRFRVS